MQDSQSYLAARLVLEGQASFHNLHNNRPGLSVFLMPPGGPRFLASAGFGYVRKYMTRSMQTVRAIGAVILLVGAWASL